MRVADIRVNDPEAPPVRAAVYYLLHRGAQTPGKRVRRKSLEAKDASNGMSRLAAWLWKVFAGVGALQLLSRVMKRVLTPSQPVQSFREMMDGHEVWSHEELGVTSWVGEGHTGGVFVGRINDLPAAIKTADYWADPEALKELQHESAAYDEMQELQGRAIPRKLAEGYIKEISCYFLATELLEGSLAEADLSLRNDLLPAAAEALELVHRHGIFHGDVRPENFLRVGNRVMVADFGCAELKAEQEKLLEEEEELKELFVDPWEAPAAAAGKPRGKASDLQWALVLLLLCTCRGCS